MRLDIGMNWIQHGAGDRHRSGNRHVAGMRNGMGAREINNLFSVSKIMPKKIKVARKLIKGIRA